MLDVGCADGQVTLALHEAVGAQETYGVDISADSVAVATARGVRAFQVDLDAEDLPFDEGFFDAIYCGEVIEHVFDPGRLLKEIRRVLKQGGICVLTTPNLAGWPNRIVLLFGYQPYPLAVSPDMEWAGKLFLRDEEGQWGHLRVFTVRALTELVTSHGFSVERIEGCAVTVSRRTFATRLIQSLDRWFARIPGLANRVIVVLKKT
jgi:SAM-dependent methyltransferase